MSTGLSGEQLDALRAEIYAELEAADDVATRMSIQNEDDRRRHIELSGKTWGIARSLYLLDKARRQAAEHKVVGKR